MVDDWGSEHGKVVLDSTWARMTIQKGRPLLAAESWGGLRLLNEIAESSVEQSPLPTPRQTPSDIGPNRPALDQAMPDYPAMPMPSQSVDGSGAPFIHPNPTTQMHQPSDAWMGVHSQGFTDSPDRATTQMTVPVDSVHLVASMLDVLRHGGFANHPAFNAIKHPRYFRASLCHPTYHSKDPSPNNSAVIQPCRLSLKRKSSSSDALSTPSVRSKGKERATPPGQISKQMRMSPSPDDAYMDVSPSSSQRSPPATPRLQGDIFKNGDGEPLQFFVQLDIRTRSYIVQLIKKNGGKVVSDIPVADYAVLGPNSKTFVDLLRSAEVANTPAVQANFVIDSVEDEALLDETARASAHESESCCETRVKKTKEEPNAKTKEKSSTRLEGNGATKAAEKKQRVPKKGNKARAEATDLKHAFPSPPPPTKIVKWHEGKNLFTTEERIYFINYLGVLLARDPDITQTAIAAKMAEKMDGHTRGSWLAYATRQRNEIDQCRKRAHIARRKASQSSQPQQDPVAGSPPASAGEPSSPPPTQPPPQPTTSQSDDCDVLAQWFADGGADDKTDDQYPWRTGEEWQNFWNDRGDAINDEVLRITTARAEVDGTK
ncbi:hypothetical protein B0H21DRAFT_868708 [Amylocystis lapponica]|nr:hypothetical protein B0H21DRAFT_868708 [Amylocystis lapponica]